MHPQSGLIKVHKNIDTDPGHLFDLVFPFLDVDAVAVECVSYWHWLADSVIYPDGCTV